MAFVDYHACDHCGERKTFYDADMDLDWVDSHWRYEANGTHKGYRLYALCHECEQTHKIVIIPKVMKFE